MLWVPGGLFSLVCGKLSGEAVIVGLRARNKQTKKNLTVATKLLHLATQIFRLVASWLP